MNCYSIQHLPESERPRERLIRHGAEILSTAELIAIVLGSGTRAIPVLQLSQELVAKFGSLNRLAEATTEELCQIPGIGPAKALQLKACFTLGSRMTRQTIPPKYKIDSPLHAYHLVKEEMEQKKSEELMSILLDSKNQVICRQIVAIGTLTQTLIHPREVFYSAIRHKASSIILVHNHPSGDPTPSKQDLEATKRILEAGKVIGISLSDHLIIGDSRYISLKQLGIIE
jgi:DNA repair protein RadC